jgi:hypothetical protein
MGAFPWDAADRDLYKVSDFSMPDNTNQNAGTSPRGNRPESRFSLRALLVLMAACAFWLWLLLDMRSWPIEFAIFALITLAIGVCGHFLYTYVFHWRGIVVLASFLLFFLITSAASGTVRAGFLLIKLPVEFFMHQSLPDRMTYTIPALVSILILAAAHPIKPSFPTAIITTLGVSSWFGVAMLIGANAG